MCCICGGANEEGVFIGHISTREKIYLCSSCSEKAANHKKAFKKFVQDYGINK